jgi:hypothetical protein
MPLPCLVDAVDTLALPFAREHADVRRMVQFVIDGGQTTRTETFEHIFVPTLLAASGQGAGLSPRCRATSGASPPAVASRRSTQLPGPPDRLAWLAAERGSGHDGLSAASETLRSTVRASLDVTRVALLRLLTATSATPSPSATTRSGDVQRCAPKGEGRQEGPPAKASDQEYHADDHEDSEGDGPCLGVSVVIPVHLLIAPVRHDARLPRGPGEDSNAPC